MMNVSALRRFILCALMLPALFATSATGETLTLQECLARASAGNRGLKAKVFDQVIAAENVSMATSAWFPRIDFQGGYTSQLDPQSIQISPTQTLATQDATFGFFSFAMTYTLYDFGRREARDSQAALVREVAGDLYRGQEQDLSFQVVRGYFGVLQARHLLRVADEEVTRLNDHLRVARTLYEQGVVTRNDVLQAEVRLAGSRQRRLAAENEVEKGWLLLNYLTAQPESYRADLDESTGMYASLPATDTDDAVDNRPEYLAQQKAVQAADFEVNESKTAYYPEIFLKAGMDYVENSTVTEQALYGATVGFRFNLFEGNATAARLRQSVARRSQNEARLSDLAAQLRLELATARRDASVARERINVTEQAIRQAEENARINTNRYVEKVGTATEVLDAQTLLTQTRVEYAAARFDYQVALARVKKARGEL